MFKKFLSIIIPRDEATHRADVYRDVIREGARIGGTLFGPVPKGSRREFFCLDEHTWVWHEEWTDTSSIRHTRTTRYDVRPNGIFKAQDGMPYQPVTAEEARRLTAAALQYERRVHEKFDPLLAVS